MLCNFILCHWLSIVNSKDPRAVSRFLSILREQELINEIQTCKKKSSGLEEGWMRSFCPGYECLGHQQSLSEKVLRMNMQTHCIAFILWCMDVDTEVAAIPPCESWVSSVSINSCIVFR